MKNALRNIANGAVLVGGVFLFFGAIVGVFFGGIAVMVSDWLWYFKLLASSPVLGCFFWWIGRQWLHYFNSDVWSRR